MTGKGRRDCADVMVDETSEEGARLSLKKFKSLIKRMYAIWPIVRCMTYKVEGFPNWPDGVRAGDLSDGCISAGAVVHIMYGPADSYTPPTSH